MPFDNEVVSNKHSGWSSDRLIKLRVVLVSAQRPLPSSLYVSDVESSTAACSGGASERWLLLRDKAKRVFLSALLLGAEIAVNADVVFSGVL